MNREKKEEEGKRQIALLGFIEKVGKIIWRRGRSISPEKKTVQRRACSIIEEYHMQVSRAQEINGREK